MLCRRTGRGPAYPSNWVGGSCVRAWQASGRDSDDPDRYLRINMYVPGGGAAFEGERCGVSKGKWRWGTWDEGFYLQRGAEALTFENYNCQFFTTAS